MALLHCLHAYQESLQQETNATASAAADGDNGVFEMAAVVVDLAYEGYDLLPLVNYLKALGVTLFSEKQSEQCSLCLSNALLIIFFKSVFVFQT